MVNHVKQDMLLLGKIRMGKMLLIILMDEQIQIILIPFVPIVPINNTVIQDKSVCCMYMKLMR